MVLTTMHHYSAIETLTFFGPKGSTVAAYESWVTQGTGIDWKAPGKSMPVAYKKLWKMVIYSQNTH